MSGQRALLSQLWGSALSEMEMCSVSLGDRERVCGLAQRYAKTQPRGTPISPVWPSVSHPLSLTLRFPICDSGRIQNACQCYFFTEAGFWNLSDSLGSVCLERLPGCSAKVKWASETQMWQGAVSGNRKWESSEHSPGSQSSLEGSAVCNRQRPAASLSLRWRQHLWRDDSFWQIILGTL